MMIIKYLIAAVSRRGSVLAHWWEEQAWPVRLYSSGVMVMLVSLVFWVIRLTYRGLPQMIFLLGALLLVSGIVIEGYRLADKILATRPGKVLGALVATMIGALSMAISSGIVNHATGFSPSEFPYTVTFLAPLTAGYIILLAAIGLFFVALISILLASVVSIWQSWRRPRREMEWEYTRMLFRLVAAIMLLSLIVTSWTRQHQPYEESLVSLAGWFAYTFEMYEIDACVTAAGEHVRHTGSDKVLVGYEHGGHRIFFVRQCRSVVVE